MFQLLTYLSCCVLIANASTLLPVYDETELPTELPIDPPISGADDLMTANKINWLIHAQGQDKDHWRVIREVDNMQQLADSTAAQQTITTASTTERLITTEAVKAQPEPADLPVTKPPEPEVKPNPREGDVCPSTAERGLTALIRSARYLLPVEELRNIMANARDDSEVRELLKLVRSDQFMERVERLRSTKELVALRNSLCQDLKLNHAYYIEFLRVFINTQATEKPSKPLPNRRKGIRGLLLDMRSVLPRAQLRNLYQRQLAVDKDLSQAVRRIRSTEFRRLLANVRILKEYRSIRAELEKVGVPVQQMLSLVSSALGWGSLEIGTEIDILYI